jgi:ABC-2 type transport system permease protein
MRSTEGFGLVMNFLVTPLLFLSGALYPLNNLPSWLVVLTRLDPVTYGIDAIRRVVLAATGVPQPVIDQLGVTLFGRPLDPLLDASIVLALGLLLIAVAARQFERPE